ncbi:glycosyltransferase family 2 protein [Pseudoclavibacter helvolus]|uniref:glycosyltransferase family 2 protein n=1 Tax=Pseudoclavibacter helvolus TaxID=255205 RepID=UPI003C791BF0
MTVVIPAKSEAANLEVMLPRLPLDLEVIVVEAGAEVETAEVVARQRPDATLITQTRRGKGNALACGFAAASGDIIVMFDADGSADPAEIPRFVDALIDGADFAKGSRFLPGGGSEDITLLRRAGNAGLNLTANLAFGTRFSDLCYGYNAFWRDMLPVLDLPEPGQTRSDEMLWGDGFEIETIINCRMAAADASIREVPSFERHRLFGASHLRTWADGTRVLRTLASERSRAMTSRDRAMALTSV